MISGVLLRYPICRYDMAGYLAPASFRARSLALEEYRCRIDESSLDEHIISDCLTQMEASLNREDYLCILSAQQSWRELDSHVGLKSRCHHSYHNRVVLTKPV